MIHTKRVGVCIVRKACVMCDQLAELKAFITSSVMTAQYYLEACIHRVPSIALPAIVVNLLIAPIVYRSLRNPC